MHTGFAFNENMRVSAHDFLSQVMIKTGHHTDDDDQGHHADGYTGNGHKINHAKELVLFSAQIPECQPPFKIHKLIAPALIMGIKSRP